ncbi:gibberellin 2-beta-dioxygenase 8-like isoform X1 [Salvia splendens]|uniref:gibberellin 2-beta-dioxygenase 8-like isoform X1 n=1 Tax=Salvia splendens TaxID=180675 RepID=UPI001C2720BD|nr:gibberellin 2-beta-dioxygenase 8-like isoform X1 [Salvia splendens]XP_041992545.1 gibberellin 2-beta-dioxygenase 8-like isoform X1 [Salvia splendens]
MENHILVQEPQTRLLKATVPVCNSDCFPNQEFQADMRMSESADPPFEIAYKHLLEKAPKNVENSLSAVEECELPLIDMQQLALGEAERQECRKLIARASQEWGFFQVINHGASRGGLENMRSEQMKLMRKPFQEKKAYKDLNLSDGTYRWGAPLPTSLKQLSWSEAFHVRLSDILDSRCSHNTIRLRSSMEEFVFAICEVAKELAEILAEEMGRETDLFREECLPESCYLRLNRYPPCPNYSRMMGLMPHTDTSFLTVLHQDNVGGLQLVKDGKWIAVKPNPDALIINIGDLFQAWSNNLYKSVEHRVVANPVKERFSTAYFLCPPTGTVIESGGVGGAVYRTFSFGEYKKQIELDVKNVGQKVGLPRFLLPTH